MTAADSEFVLVGRVRRAHGIRGEVVVECDSDVPERFAVGAELDLVTAAGRRPVSIETVRGHAGRLLVRFAGVTDRELAQRLRGARLEVAARLTPPPAPDTYYYFELVGCACHDRQHGDLGRVVDVIEDGGGLLLAVEQGQRTLLVPFVRRYLVAVDRQARRIDLDLPAGLVEACASRS